MRTPHHGPQVAPKGRSCKRPAGAPSGCDSAGAPSRRPLRRPGHALTIARFSRFCHAFMEAYWPAELNYNYRLDWRSEEHTSELQSLMRISYAVFCLNKKKYKIH